MTKPSDYIGLPWDPSGLEKALEVRTKSLLKHPYTIYTIEVRLKEKPDSEAAMLAAAMLARSADTLMSDLKTNNVRTDGWLFREQFMDTKEVLKSFD